MRVTLIRNATERKINQEIVELEKYRYIEKVQLSEKDCLIFHSCSKQGILVKETTAEVTEARKHLVRFDERYLIPFGANIEGIKVKKKGWFSK